ncbi:MAG: hypothetical protein IT562_08685 [Alphaproteobacteria bacterium]|nr:hypothetical protein [Alphaproteobacteria bacterium]
MMRARTTGLTALVAALLASAMAGTQAGAQAIGPGASVECDPVGVGNYRSGIVREVDPGGQSFKVELDDFSPNGGVATCPAAKLRAVPRDAFVKGPPAAYGIFHSGDRIECGVAENGIPLPGSVVTVVDPRGVYGILFDGTEPGGAPRTCDGAQMKRFSGLPVGGRGFKR